MSPPRSNGRSFARRRAVHLRLGRRGERIAGRLLAELGFELLVRNYRCGEGEIDLVAREKHVLCFIEVKTRRRAGTRRPAEAVGRAKRRHIIRAARRYLREIGRPPVPHRFDIVEVILDRGVLRNLRLHRGAFTDEKVPRSTLPGHFPSMPRRRERDGGPRS